MKSFRSKLEEEASAQKVPTMPTSWERMLPEQVRKAQHDLQTERIEGRHVNSVCRVGKGRFCGKIHYKEGYYYLETIHIDTVRDAMKEEGYTPRRNRDGIAANVWTQIQSKEEETNCVNMPSPWKVRQPLRRGDAILYVGRAAA